MLYDIRVQLEQIEPPIWRTVRVPSCTSLSKLHRILQPVMGWQNCHVHLFEVNGKEYGEPSPEWNSEVLNSRNMTLEKIFSRGTMSFSYEYDLGDSWMHKITLVGMVEGEEKIKCTAGARACPPEDCGGTMGYYHLLVAISDPTHEEHETMLEWVGGKFDPHAFNIVSVNKILTRLR